MNELRSLELKADNEIVMAVFEFILRSFKTTILVKMLGRFFILYPWSLDCTLLKTST